MGFDAKKVRIQFPCRQVTILDCGKGMTFTPQPEPPRCWRNFSCRISDGCGRLSPIVACQFGSIDLTVPTEATDLIGCGISNDPTTGFLRVDDLPVMKAVLASRVKELEDQVRELAELETMIEQKQQEG